MAASVISNTSKWKEFLTRYYKNQIQQLAVSDAKNKALVIEYPHINRFDVRLAEELMASPDVVLAHAEEALTMVDLPVKKEISARVRVAKVPKKTQVRDLRSIDVNRFTSIEGTIRKITDVRPRIIEAAFECARCKNITIIPQEGGGKFIEPTYCSCNEEKKGVFRLLYKESRFEDYQRIKIQESPDELKGGEQPQTLDINVSDDLAGQVTPGEHITVNGILRSAQKINKDGKTAYFDIYMDGNSIELEEQEYDEVDISPEDEEEIIRLSKDPRVYDKIVFSIAPSIYGYEEVKEAIAHQLFSGVVKSLPDGTRIRGDIHVLLVGDPGIAKSQILRYVVKLAPRGVYASGKSASSAGLTAAAVKDEFDGQWTLEAGALVLADKGVACIDEMDKMKNEDRSSLHEGMEVSDDQRGQGRHPGDAEMPLLHPGRRQPETGTVRPLREHPGADQHAPVADVPLRSHLHPAGQARGAPGREHRRPHPEIALRRRAQRAAAERGHQQDHGGLGEEGHVGHPAGDRAPHAPQVRRLREAEDLPDHVGRGPGTDHQLLSQPA